jgi:hypothetical protein
MTSPVTRGRRPPAWRLTGIGLSAIGVAAALYAAGRLVQPRGFREAALDGVGGGGGVAEEPGSQRGGPCPASGTGCAPAGPQPAGVRRDWSLARPGYFMPTPISTSQGES